MRDSPVVRLTQFSAGFRRGGRIQPILRNVNLEIRQGDLVCLLGPSGSGKSVLLNLIIGSLTSASPSVVLSGNMEVLGQSIMNQYPESISENLGIVFQENALFEDLTPRENVAFGLNGKKLDRGSARQRIDALLESVNLPDPGNRIQELSGGQKKRLALARTLAREPAFLLFDEPTTGQDPHLCRQIASLIEKTHAEGQGRRTTLIVTHDYEAVLPIATRVFLLDPSRGTVEEIDKSARPGDRLAKMTVRRAEPEQEGTTQSLFRYLESVLKKPLAWLEPLASFLTQPMPAGLRQVLLRFADTLILPALYVCAAGAVLGGLATFFALENNPLKGAMDRQALIGLGKVVLAIVIPLMTSILFAARVGAGAAARLGNIRLGRQDDALRMLGANPTAVLITPLFWTCLIGLPLLVVPVSVSSSLASMTCACAARPITPYGWATAFFSEITAHDFYYGIIKLMGSGMIVAATSTFFGLRPKAGAEDLGRDVTGTLVTATFLVILWHGFFTFLQYGPTA